MLEGETIVVFADDWGVHPSSAQHLMRRFLAKNRVVWFDTVGLRLPRPTIRDGRKILRKIASWTGLGGGAGSAGDPRPEVADLPLAPLPLGEAARRVNSWQLARAVMNRLGPEHLAERPPFIVTTLPLTVDLVGEIPGATFVYYLVDDYGSWPGLGRSLVRRMDEEQMERADLVVAASGRLRELAAAHAPGRTEYLPHGVDAPHFARARRVREERARRDEPPLAEAVFFGAIDERIDQRLLLEVVRRRPHVRFLVVGPGDRLDERFGREPNVLLHEAVPYAELPEWLGQCDVAVLPYVTGEFGRRLAPLKVREALAAGLPVVGTDVPELRSLRSGVEIASSAEDFADEIDRALAGGSVPPLEHLAPDTWEARSERFSELLLEARRKTREPVA